MMKLRSVRYQVLKWLGPPGQGRGGGGVQEDQCTVTGAGVVSDQLAYVISDLAAAHAFIDLDLLLKHDIQE